MAIVQLPCPKCGNPVQAAVEEPKVLNFEGFSLIVIEHSSSRFCVCGISSVPGVQQIGGVGMGLIPIQPKNLVTPAADLPKN